MNEEIVGVEEQSAEPDPKTARQLIRRVKRITPYMYDRYDDDYYRQMRPNMTDPDPRYRQ